MASPPAATLRLKGSCCNGSHMVLQARIHPYFPFFHVDVTADVHIFCPDSGHTLSEASSTFIDETLSGTDVSTYQCWIHHDICNIVMQAHLRQLA